MAIPHFILYFVPGFAPSAKDIEYVSTLEGVTVSYRNAGYVRENDNLESCDAVGGPAVPKSYADAYPSIEEYYGKLAKDRKAAADDAAAIAGKKPRKISKSEAKAEDEKPAPALTDLKDEAGWKPN